MDFVTHLVAIILNIFCLSKSTQTAPDMIVFKKIYNFMLPSFLDKDEKSSVATIISIHGYYYCIIMWFVLF